MHLVCPGVDEFEHRHVREGEDAFDVTRRVKEFDQKVKCACARCNNEWMDQLDHAAEDLFLTKAAVWGAPIRLDKQADVALLARWVLVTAALYDQMQARPVMETDAHRDLYEGRIPPGAWVWLLRTDPPEWQISGWSEPTELTFRPTQTAAFKVYLATFGVKHFVAQAYVPERAAPAIEIIRDNNAQILSQLWPPTFRPFIWPPNTFRWDDRSTLKATFNTPPEASEGTEHVAPVAHQ